MVIGLITGAAAVAFHQLIDVLRDLLYMRVGAANLYGRDMVLLIVWPAMGGVLVGIISRHVFRPAKGTASWM